MTATQTKEREAPAPVAAVTTGTAMTAPAQQAPIGVIDGVEIPAVIRQRDDELMLASFMGEVVDTWFYEFEIAGKKVEGVGVIGADEFARIQAEHGSPITVVPYGINIVEVVRNEERGVQATVVMRDARTRRESVGVAFYPYYLTKKNGQKVYDDKADRKALSVAKRNAILDLIPQEEILAVLKARKQLIAQNKARIQAATQRAIAAAPTVTKVYDHDAEVGRGPYENPTPLQSTRAPREAHAEAAPRKLGRRASEEQIEKLLNLLDDPSVNEKARAAVTEALETGITENQANRWIEQLVDWIASAGTEPTALPLGAK